MVLGILLVSYVLPNVVGAAAFSWLFDTNFGGVANYLLTSITGTEILWFTDVWPNRILIILDTVWHLLPFSMLIILAGLQGVPDRDHRGGQDRRRHIAEVAPVRDRARPSAECCSSSA